MSRTVTHVVDDSGNEEIECVARQAQGVETKPVEVDLWVFECFADPSPGELLVSSSVTVLEPCENAFLLLWSEEPSSCGVVMDEEVCGNGRNDSQQALLERHISPDVENRRRKIHDDEDPPPTSQTPNSPHFCEGIGLKLRERSIEDEART